MLSKKIIDVLKDAGLSCAITIGLFILATIPFCDGPYSKLEAVRRARLTPEKRAEEDRASKLITGLFKLAAVGVVTEMIVDASKPQVPIRTAAKKEAEGRSKARSTTAIPPPPVMSNDWWAGSSQHEDSEAISVDLSPSDTEESEESSRRSGDILLRGHDGRVAHRVTSSTFGEDRLVLDRNGRVTHRVVDSWDGKDKLLVGNDGRVEHRVTDDLFGKDKLVIGNDGAIEYRITDELFGDGKVAIDSSGNVAYRIEEED